MVHAFHGVRITPTSVESEGSLKIEDFWLKVIPFTTRIYPLKLNREWKFHSLFESKTTSLYFV
jgi:hypothetical protein